MWGRLRAVARAVAFLAVTVCCFQDLRGSPCKRTDTYEQIPADMAEWTGTINITMDCDQGFDLPLNAPKQATFICRPDGSPWQPDYLPDCNERMLPTSVTSTMVGKLSLSRCKNLEKLSVQSGMIKFSSGIVVTIEKMCEQSSLGLCKVVTANISCDVVSHGQYSSEFAGLPTVVVLLEFSYSETLTLDFYKTKLSDLALSFVRGLEPSASNADVKAIVVMNCRAATLPVLQAGKYVLCRGCSLGHYLDINKKACLPCKPGYYTDQTLSVQCKICPGIGTDLPSSVWEDINNKVPDRAFMTGMCPLLYKHDNGSIEVKLAEDLDSAAKIVRPRNWGPHSDTSHVTGSLAVSMVASMIVFASI